MKTTKMELGPGCAQGSFLGLILFAVTLVVLSMGKTGILFGENTMRLILFLGAELAVGILVTLLRNRPRRVSKESSRIFTGIAGMNILYAAVFLGLWIISFFSNTIQMVMGINLITLIIFEIGEYCYSRKISKEMNRNLFVNPGSLLIDLKGRPKTKGEYIDLIISSAAHAKLPLEIITDEYPAVVKLNNVLHKAEIESWYGYAGLEYSLKFKEIAAYVEDNEKRE